MANSPRNGGGAGRGGAFAGVLIGALLAGWMLTAAPAPAMAEDKSADELATEALDRLLRALDLLIGAIPQYEAPYVNEDGDIIIKRKRDDEKEPLPTPEEKPTPPGDADTTTT